jgi:hypothetical protein
MGDSLGAIGRSFAPLFEEHGHQLVEIDFRTDGAEVLNNHLQGSDILLTFAFLGMGADIRITSQEGEKLNVWETFNIPYISLYGDTPAYFFDRHVMPSKWCAAMYAFPEHAALRARLPRPPTILGVSPPGPMEPVPRAEIDFRKKERGRLLFLKNGNDPEELVNQWRESLSTNIFLMLMDVAGDLVTSMGRDNGSDIDERVRRYFENRGLDVENAANLRLFFIAQLDDYLRRVKSNLLAKVLMDFPVDMFGHNWEHLDFSNKRICFTSGGDYTKSAPMIRDALGMIDMSPNTDLGAHERPLRAFGSYTLCLTNRQSFFERNVKGAEDFSFRFDGDEISSKVADVISHPKRYVEIGASAAEDFRGKYSSSRFADLLFDTAAAVRLMNGQRPGKLQTYFGWPPAAL